MQTMERRMNEMEARMRELSLAPATQVRFAKANEAEDEEPPIAPRKKAR